VKHFDIGANNEPNGHGTVAYNKVKLESILKNKSNEIEA